MDNFLCVLRGRSLRPSRLQAFALAFKTRAFNREDREGSAKIAKKGVFLDLQHGFLAVCRTFSCQSGLITASRLLP
jgi:hypothetical protein